jgi:hypothetical protein
MDRPLGSAARCVGLRVGLRDGATYGKELTLSGKSLSHRGVIHLGLDVSKDWIAVGGRRPEERVAEVDKIAHDEESVRRRVMLKLQGELDGAEGGSAQSSVDSSGLVSQAAFAAL